MISLTNEDLSDVCGGNVPNPCEASTLNSNLGAIGVPPIIPSGPGYPVGLCTSTAVSNPTGVLNALTGIGGHALPNFLSSSGQNGLSP